MISIANHHSTTCRKLGSGKRIEARKCTGDGDMVTCQVGMWDLSAEDEMVSRQESRDGLRQLEGRYQNRRHTVWSKVKQARQNVPTIVTLKQRMTSTGRFNLPRIDACRTVVCM